MFAEELMTTLTQFKNAIVQFIDELIELFPLEADLVVMRVFMDTQIETSEIMKQFIKHVAPHAQLIKDRNESFFLTTNDIFGTVEMGKVMHCKKIWVSGQLDAEDKRAIWKWFDLFLALVQKYQQQLKKYK